MGSVAEDILPIVGIAVLSYFTAGAAAGALVPAEAGSLVASKAVINTAATEAITFASKQVGIQTISSGLTAAQGIQLGATALSTVGGIVQNNAAAQQKAALTVEKKNAEVSLTNQQLQTEERQKGVQDKLSRALAAQRVSANASGINPNTGSAENKVDSLFASADDALNPLAVQSRILGLQGRANASRFNAGRGAIRQNLFSENTDALIGFGKSVQKIFKPRKV